MSIDQQKIIIVSRKDCDVSYFCGSGKGGQKKNKTASGVLIIHKASGAQGRCSDSRSQQNNKKQAFERLVKTTKFKLWFNQKLLEIEKQKTLENIVIEETLPQFLQFKIRDSQGKIVEVSPDYFDSDEAKKEN